MPVALLLATLLVPAPSAASEARLSPPLVWLADYGGPRLPLAIDADADGMADFLGLYTGGEGILDAVRTSELGKPHGMIQARNPFGGGAACVLGGAFGPAGEAGVLAIRPSGELLLTWGWDPAAKGFASSVACGSMPAPGDSALACTLDADSDGRADALVVSPAAGTFLLHSAPDEKGGPHLVVRQVAAGPAGATRLAAGQLDGPGAARVVWLTVDGLVRSAALGLKGEWCALEDERVITKAAPDEQLAVGRFRGGEQVDLIVSDRLYPAGRAEGSVALPGAPSAAEARGDLAWIAADVTGDGLDDLLRHRRSGERFVGDNVLLQVSYAGAADPSFLDSDGDGLRDSWETGAVRPAGLDLPSIGCEPDHADVIVEIQPIDGVDLERMRGEMARCQAFYDALRVTNPNGEPGIGLRLIYREAIPKEREVEGWGALGEAFHPAEHRGITHWMLITAGGGGQSGQMADRGSCGQAALYAVFLHEFGHQVGLDHSGYWRAAWCPIYSSMMSYAYSYQYAGDGNRIRYSDGSLDAIVLDERNLDEHLPLPPERLDFLSGPPYRYSVRPSDDGQGSLVDWDWDGVFGETGVVADINYGYSTYAGDRHHLGKTRSAPALTEVERPGQESALALLACDRTANGAPTGPWRLYARVWAGDDPATQGGEWGPEVDLVPDGVTGDPTVIAEGERITLAYPTAAGVEVRTGRLTPEGAVAASEPLAIPDSAGAAPTLVRFGGKRWVILWRGADRDLGIAPLTEDGIGAEAPIALRSLWPVGASGGEGVLWLGYAADEPGGHPTRWAVASFRPTEDGGFAQASQEWIQGPGGESRGCERVSLLWEPGPDGGQVWFYQCGLFGKDTPWSCHFVGTRVANQDVHHGWLVRRYYDEWSESRSGPGVCWFRGDIAYALRWHAAPETEHEDRLMATFFARGIDREPMGDFDDIGFVRSVGLTQSIPALAP